MVARSHSGNGSDPFAAEDVTFDPFPECTGSSRPESEAGESPALLKLVALQKVIESDLSDGDKFFLVEFMNTYAPTGELFDPREEIMQKLADVEMTWGERLRVEGRVEGEQKMLLRLLALIFGEVPATLEARIMAITDEATLTMLAQQILTIKRLEDLVLPDEDSGSGITQYSPAI